MNERPPTNIRNSRELEMASSARASQQEVLRIIELGTVVADVVVVGIGGIGW